MVAVRLAAPARVSLSASTPKQSAPRATTPTSRAAVGSAGDGDGKRRRGRGSEQGPDGCCSGSAWWTQGRQSAGGAVVTRAPFGNRPHGRCRAMGELATGAEAQAAARCRCLSSRGQSCRRSAVVQKAPTPRGCYGASVEDANSECPSRRSEVLNDLRSLICAARCINGQPRTSTGAAVIRRSPLSRGKAK